jgi:hypothetical protein
VPVPLVEVPSDGASCDTIAWTCSSGISLRKERPLIKRSLSSRQRPNRRPRTVYTAAYVPDSGETIDRLSVGYAPGAFLAHLAFAASLPFAIVDPQSFPEAFARDLNPKLGAEIAAQQRPTSLLIFGSPSAPGAWKRFMAQRAGSTTVQFSAASHVGGLTHYAARF